MNRRVFVQCLSLSAAGLSLRSAAWAAAPAFPVVRPAVAQRRFQSKAVEAAIAEFKQQVPDPELAWLFGNCLPNALDTTVTPGTHAGRPDTYVRLGDLDAMELRDSAAQVWPYLTFVTQDAPLRQLVAGVINRHTRCILQDPYASAFYQNLTRVGEPPTNQMPNPPGGYERQWAADSLCYPIRLAYHYWKTTGDEQPFDAQWRQAIALVVNTFRAQQRPAAATQPPTGLIASAFQPNGEPAQLPFSVPGNFFAVASLRQAALMLNDIHHDDKGYANLMTLADKVATALRQHAVVPHPTLGPVYAYAVDGHGGHLLLDDAQVPSLLALPYLGALPLNDPIYQNTRKLALSSANPLFYQGTAAEGIGSPRTGANMIWPLSLVLCGFSSTDDAEIRGCVRALQATHAGTGYLYESFHKDNPAQYIRPWFAAVNTLCGEFLWKVYKERPQLLG